MKPPQSVLHDDARVLDLIRKGDEEGLVMLYRSNRKPVTAYVVANSGTYDDAEDMLQEALVILWERIRTGRFVATSRLDTFVYATVKHMWLRRLARKRREITGAYDGVEIPDGDASPLERVMESEQAGRVRWALEKIGEPCRTLLLLFYWDELPMAEIAERLGFANADTVKAKKYQCKKLLLGVLQQAPSGEDDDAH